MKKNDERLYETLKSLIVNYPLQSSIAIKVFASGCPISIKKIQYSNYFILMLLMYIYSESGRADHCRLLKYLWKETV